MISPKMPYVSTDRWATLDDTMLSMCNGYQRLSVGALDPGYYAP